MNLGEPTPDGIAKNAWDAGRREEREEASCRRRNARRGSTRTHSRTRIRANETERDESSGRSRAVRERFSDLVVVLRRSRRTPWRKHYATRRGAADTGRAAPAPAARAVPIGPRRLHGVRPSRPPLLRRLPPSLAARPGPRISWARPDASLRATASTPPASTPHLITRTFSSRSYLAP
ncbi:hypothetical protein PUN28_006221 [Cardiocondyla obscurior]|uniref:Uncharacterized protein n=1 Tax=Cardiocondyla obscurior TaxID=286306 RepID=A0AAW2GAH7_9HYME